MQILSQEELKEFEKLPIHQQFIEGWADVKQRAKELPKVIGHAYFMEMCRYFSYWLPLIKKESANGNLKLKKLAAEIEAALLEDVTEPLH